MTEAGAGAWQVERHVGSARAFHDRNLPDPVRRAVWWFEVTEPTVVLGSTQTVAVVDAAAAARSGVEVVRRRSGGGAVWLAPGVTTWVDVVLPAGDPHWVDDVGRAAAWLGEAWVAALEELGVADLLLHEGPMIGSARSGLVCFAGVSPGEVTVGGRKVVGVSQRRTRHGARFQCVVLHQWDPRPLIEVLDLPLGERETMASELAGVGAGIGAVEAAAVVAGLVAQLRTDA